jgi:flagellar protein FliO/FliZ
MRALLSRGLAALLLAGSCLSAAATLPTVPTAAAEPVHTSFGAAGLLQAGLGLGLVLAMIFGCAWLVRRFGLQPGGNGRLLKVVCSAMVGQRERVVVVEVGGQWLVLGVAAGRVNALHSMPAQAVSDPGTAATVPGFAAAGVFSGKLLESLNKLKKREG